MLTRNRIVYILVVVAVLLLAMGLTNLYATPGQSQEKAIPTLAPTPELEVKHHVKGDRLFLEFRLKYFELSQEKMGNAPVYGEGHIHLYVDNQKMTKIFKSAYVHPGLTPGKHVIKVELAHHNHESYGIEKEFAIQITRGIKETFLKEDVQKVREK